MPIKMFPTTFVLSPALPQACYHLSAIQKTQVNLSARQVDQIELKAIYKRCT